MRHDVRNKSFEVELAKRELIEEEKSISDYVWEDDCGYEIDDPKHPNYFDSVVDYFDLFGRDF